jgi:UDP-N-acetylmuramoyl-tripeptide--D-alanyl-D-alanine ligase
MTASDQGAGLFPLARAAAETGAAVLGDIARARALSVCIDSRQAGPGSLFAALPGENADGHDFIEDAYARGCRATLASSQGFAQREGRLRPLAMGGGMSFVLYENSLSGLQSLAAWYLDLFPRLLKIGVTGSSGKTTVKEMIGAILARGRRVVMNEGNLNSETGLPLSIFKVRAEHEAGVFELGMNHEGEMDGLAATLRPSLALVTNVGTAHIGILGSKDKIALEKKKIFSRFTGSEVGFVDEDEAYLGFLTAGMRGKAVAFGPRSLKGYRGSEAAGLDGTSIDWEGSRFSLPLPGPHNLRNALGAMSLCLEAGCGAQDIRAGLSGLKPLFGRGEVLRGRATVLRDCYNANPEAMEAAIAFCDSIEWKGGRKVYVLGSMLELGAASAEAHRGLGAILAASRADAVYLFGAETASAEEAIRTSAYGGKVFMTDDPAKMEEALAGGTAQGDLVLLKGSRGMRMERFEQAFGIPTPALGIPTPVLGIPRPALGIPAAAGKNSGGGD